MGILKKEAFQLQRISTASLQVTEKMFFFFFCLHYQGNIMI